MKATQFYYYVWQNFLNHKKSIEKTQEEIIFSLNKKEASLLNQHFNSIKEEGMRDSAVFALSKFSKRDIEEMREMIALDNYELRSVIEEALFVRGEME